MKASRPRDRGVGTELGPRHALRDRGEERAAAATPARTASRVERVRPRVRAAGPSSPRSRRACRARAPCLRPDPRLDAFIAACLLFTQLARNPASRRSNASGTSTWRDRSHSPSPWPAGRSRVDDDTPLPRSRRSRSSSRISATCVAHREAAVSGKQHAQTLDGEKYASHVQPASSRAHTPSVRDTNLVAAACTHDGAERALLSHRRVARVCEGVRRLLRAERLGRARDSHARTVGKRAWCGTSFESTLRGRVDTEGSTVTGGAVRLKPG